jgi:Fe-S-cluster containining protein
VDGRIQSFEKEGRWAAASSNHGTLPEEVEMNNNNSQLLVGGREPLGRKRFRFACHSGLICYRNCCRRQNLFLYPYDVIRLKTRLGIDSEEFLNRHAGLVKGHNPFFPSVMLQMAANQERTCPFLGSEGCTVYEDRPSACRTYPLERGVERVPRSSRLEEHYFLVRHIYCRGHEQEQEWSVKEWVQDQQISPFNLMDDLWAEMDALFATNPWPEEGAAGPRQQLAFLVCYNIDGFRRYVRDFNLLAQFRLDRQQLQAIETGDEELLRFGFNWLKLMFAGIPTLKPRK